MNVVMPELGGPGGPWPPQYLADQLTLFQSGRADYPHLILLAPPMFFTFRHHCFYNVLTRAEAAQHSDDEIGYVEIVTLFSFLDIHNGIAMLTLHFLRYLGPRFERTLTTIFCLLERDRRPLLTLQTSMVFTLFAFTIFLAFFANNSCQITKPNSTARKVYWQSTK